MTASIKESFALAVGGGPDLRLRQRVGSIPIRLV